jgi:GT2 family glycosyltransferase
MNNKKKNPKVIIQILHYKDIDDTITCLNSLFELDYKNFEILVIDNSDKETPEDPKLLELEKNKQITLIKTWDNKGFTGGHNIGFEFSINNNADYIWVLNNDTLVLPDTLSTLVSDIESNDKIGAVSPIIYHYDTDEIQYLASIINLENKKITYTKSFDQLHAWQNEKKHFCLWGTALLLRTSMLKEIGFFYEKLFAYYEDTELSYRILKSNYENKITERSKIFHKHGLIQSNTSLRQPHFYFYMARNELLYLKIYSRGFKYIPAIQSSFLNMLEYLFVCLRNNNDTCANAVLDGFYCGVKGHGGAWKHDVHMPNFLSLFLKRFAWPIHKILTFKF